MEKILILGSEGYLGSVLVPYLLGKNKNIVGVDKCYFGINNTKKSKNFKLIKKDYSKLEKNFFSQFQIIIDLVNISNDPASELNKKLTNRINYYNKIKLYNKIKSYKNLKKYIYISSCSVYGNNSSLINEKSKPKPISLYSKLCFKYENYLKNKKEIKFTILRLGTLYGWSKRMRYDIAINKILRDIIFLKKVEILGGKQSRFFCYNKFACEVIKIIILDKKNKFLNKVYNIGIFNTNILQLTKKILEIIKMKNISILHEEHNIDRRSYKVSLSSSKKFVKKSFNFEKFVNNSIINTFEKIKKDKSPFNNKKITLSVYSDFLKNKKI